MKDVWKTTHGHPPFDVCRLYTDGQRERQKNESECNNVPSEKLCCEIIN